MNAFLLFLPFIMIRLFLFKYLNKEAYQRAQKFAPLAPNKRGYYFVYQICQLILIVFPVFQQVSFRLPENIIAVLFYILGLVILYWSIRDFVKADKNYFIQSGIYQYSRHPMYVCYFFYYLGVGLWMNSYLYIALVILFQICTHQIILAEEAWCEETFGESYIEYKEKVRRYL